MSEIICVTNRLLCHGDFLRRLYLIAQARPHALILREKDLNEDDYTVLAQSVLPLCRDAGVPLVLSGHTALAKRLNCLVQLPYRMHSELIQGGISIHSVEEAASLRKSNAAWLIAGHIWDTDCKAGIPGRGAEFLRKVVRAANQPVYGIGGITPQRMQEVRKAGAAGACVMSTVMTCNDPTAYLKEFEE